MAENVIEVELTCGLVAETPLFVDFDIKEVRSLFIQSAKALNTYALNDEFVPINSHIMSIPKEVYANDLWEISLSNGFHMTCTPNTMIMTTDGWRKVSDLAVDDQILGGAFTEERGITGRVFTVTNSQSNYKMIASPVYFFVAEHNNILLPNFEPTSGEITFVDIHQ